MSSLFSLRRSDDERPYTRLDSLLETHGITAEDILGDERSPLVVEIGGGKYVSSKDLRQFLNWRAEAALYQRMGRREPAKPEFEFAVCDDALLEPVPDVYRRPVEEALKSALADADCRAARTPDSAAA